MEEVERPANGLSIGDDEIEFVEAEPMLPIERTGHHPVNGEGCRGKTAARLRGRDDLSHRRLVVDHIDHDSQEIALATRDHAMPAVLIELQASRFCSCISRKMSGTVRRILQAGYCVLNLSLLLIHQMWSPVRLVGL